VEFNVPKTRSTTRSRFSRLERSPRYPIVFYGILMKEENSVKLLGIEIECGMTFSIKLRVQCKNWYSSANIGNSLPLPRSLWSTNHPLLLVYSTILIYGVSPARSQLSRDTTYNGTNESRTINNYGKDYRTEGYMKPKFLGSSFKPGWLGITSAKRFLSRKDS
jgi:hypothetical protein